MFNPREALERIRRNKNEKQQLKSMSEDVQPLFPQTANNPDIEKRISSLELMVSRLSEELTNSTEVISKLKRENSNLETQVLKLEYENNQLKSNQVYSEVRRNNSQKKLSSHNNTLSNEKKEEKQEKEKEPQTIRRVEPVQQKQIYSMEVEQIVQQIKRQPIQTILKKKEYNFRALRASNKQIQTGNKYLRDLVQLQKQYTKTMKKPILVIKLDDADFE